MTVRHITASTADELMEQREQSQACLGYAESRQKKTEGQKIKQLYETAFPEDEQIPWKDLMRLVEEMPLDFTAYYDGEMMEQREHSQDCLNSAESRENSTEGQTFIGFTIVYPRKSINWFWYFAVCEKLRGKGYGQKILTQMIEHYRGQSFVLDMESPTQVSCD